MENCHPWRNRLLLAGAALLIGTILALLLTGFLQLIWSHRHGAFLPEPTEISLAGLLEQPSLSSEDYTLLYHQTGLSPAAIDDYLEQGEDGRQAILKTAKGFHHAPEATCVSLIGGRFTCEDLLLNEEGKRVAAVPMAPLRAGDILLSFSTHTLGWRHGHAGLVVDPVAGLVLEAVQLGENSYQASTTHWRTYSNFLVLRVKDATQALGRKVADFAKRVLDGVPYSLLPGIVCPKGAPIEETPGVHCAYLPWFAWQQQGVDLDGNGGAIVTVADLARSPRLEVVQVFGLDPSLLEDRQAA